jgi:ribulose-5-phosphate 4-epimerase/fuculose-1-phosphate aldolase
VLLISDSGVEIRVKIEGKKMSITAVTEHKNNDTQRSQNQARIDLAAAHRLAVMHDYHEGIDNHFTLVVPGSEDRFYLNQYGLFWSEVTASNLLEVSFDGGIVSGSGIAEITAVSIHAPIHKSKRDAVCILHTHMPYCTALSQLEDMTLEMTGQAALYFKDKIAYDTDYNGFAHDMAEGQRMADVMGDKPVLMLANHGVVVTGKSVAHAYHRLYFLERACRTQLFAMWTGKPRKVVSDQVIHKMRQQVEVQNPALQMSEPEYHFAALKRILDRNEPDYAT